MLDGIIATAGAAAGTGAGGGQRHRHVERRHADRDHGRAIVPALAAIANPGDGGARGRHKVGTALFPRRRGRRRRRPTRRRRPHRDTGPQIASDQIREDGRLALLAGLLGCVLRMQNLVQPRRVRRRRRQAATASGSLSGGMVRARDVRPGLVAQARQQLALFGLGQQHRQEHRGPVNGGRGRRARRRTTPPTAARGRQAREPGTRAPRAAAARGLPQNRRHPVPLSCTSKRKAQPGPRLTDMRLRAKRLRKRRQRTERPFLNASWLGQDRNWTYRFGPHATRL